MLKCPKLTQREIVEQVRIMIHTFGPRSKQVRDVLDWIMENEENTK